jgi:hypothetical protein
LRIAVAQIGDDRVADRVERKNVGHRDTGSIWRVRSPLHPGRDIDAALDAKAAIAVHHHLPVWVEPLP